MKKNIILLLSIVLLFSCSVTKNGNTKSFKVTKVFKQAYTLGTQRPGKNSGITHSIHVDTKHSKIKIKRLWINGVNIEFTIAKTGEQSIRIRATIYGKSKDNLHNDIKEPFEYNGEALIEYIEDGELKYYIVKEFLILEKGENPR